MQNLVAFVEESSVNSGLNKKVEVWCWRHQTDKAEMVVEMAAELSGTYRALVGCKAESGPRSFFLVTEVTSKRK